jgi:hypothetical protein
MGLERIQMLEAILYTSESSQFFSHPPDIRFSLNFIQRLQSATRKEKEMKKIIFIVSLLLFVFLTACNQTSQNDLSMQGLEYGGVRFNVVSDYREGFEETNFNGKFDEGEFLVPGMNVLLTPVDEKGNPTGEALTYLTNQVQDPREGATLKLPVGWYKPELRLDDLQLQGGKDYSWVRGPEPDPLELPPIFIEPNHRFDGIFNVACEFAGSLGRQIIEVNGFDTFKKSPCYALPPKLEDGGGISVELVQGSDICGQIQAIVTVHYAKGTYHQPVTLSASNLAGMTATFSPNPTSTTSTLTLSTSGVAPGTYQITIQDSRGYSVSLTVTVNAYTIPDPNLEAAIRAALNIPAPTSLSSSDMLVLTDLIADHRNIANLEGLQCAENLSYLDINGNLISDLSPLSGLTNLSVLALQFNRISDLTPLLGLTNLYHLDLGINHISNLSPLSGLTNLQDLLLQQNSISDLTALVNNPGLGSGDIIDLKFNALDLTNPNDPDLSNIYILETLRGVFMAY